MEIRVIEKQDIVGCAELFSQVFSRDPWGEPWTNELAYNRLSHFYSSTGFMGVLAEEQGILGFALGNWEPFYFGKIFYLREMCTKPDIQSQGIGSEIYAVLEKELKQSAIKSIYLATEREIPAARFYKKQGFNLMDKMGFYAKRLGS